MKNKPTHQTIRIPRPEEIVDHLSEEIKGHEFTKHMLACAAYSHLLKCQSNLRSIRNSPSLENCLISGPTGSGKSAMLERLSDFINIPLVSVSSGSLSPNGYKGKTCNDVLDQIESIAVKDGITTPTLCLWDETCKIAYNNVEVGRADTDSGVYKRMVQSDMLGILQGIRMSDRPGLDLRKILHIACGAFPERKIAKPQSCIGFHDPQLDDKKTETQMPIPEYYIKMGLMSELVGRFPRMAIMDKLKISTIREIITDSSTSSYKQKIWHFAQHGTELSFTNDALDFLAEKVAAHPTGIRALQLVLNRLLSEYEYEITRSDRKAIESIHFDREAMAGITEPMIIRSSMNNTAIERSISVPTPGSDDELETISVF